MTISFRDMVKVLTTTTGTGTLTQSAAVSPFQAPPSGDDGKRFTILCAEVDANGNPDGAWEVTESVYTHSGTTWSRGTLLASSTGSRINFAAGDKHISVVHSADNIVPAITIPYVVILKNPVFVQATGANLSTGDNDLYTCPTGRRALATSISLYNQSGGTIGWYPQVKISGTYYRHATTTNTSTAAAGSHNGIIGLEAADILSINTATNNGANVQCQILEFDDSSPLKLARLLNLSSGDTTLYTCPANTRAWMLGVSLSAYGSLMQAGGTVAFVSDSGGTRTVYYHVVPSGQSVGANYRASASQSVSASTKNVSPLIAGVLTPSDFININVNTGASGQVCYALLAETPVP